MTLEKPWDRPFDDLLKKLVADMEGEVKSLDIKSVAEEYIYPTYNGEFQGVKFVVGISELPRRLDSEIHLEDRENIAEFHEITEQSVHGEDLDNVEYLRIDVDYPTNYKIQITHEDILNRIGKFLHLEYEYQTGNKEFDQKYFLRVASDKDKELIVKKEIQELILGIENFELLEISKSGIHWSQMVTNKKQLEYGTVKSYILKLVALAQAL